jgi:hypothetical protein
MKLVLVNSRLARLSLCLALSITFPSVFAQPPTNVQASAEAAQRAASQAKLQQVINDSSSYAAAIVQRWESAARASGRWDANFSSELLKALLKLQPENLLAAGEATSYESMMYVLATGRQISTAAGSHSLSLPTAMIPDALGDAADDMVYTSVTPCRIVDTRVAGGPLAAGSTRTFDADGSTFVSQGGFNGSCGIPYGVAYAVAMTITVTAPSTSGYFTAWALGAQPFTSVLNFTAGATLANTTIVPILPGAGNDFSIFSSARAQVVVDVVGYFAAPVATALDCTTVNTAFVAVPVDSWTPITATCPVGRTATGGGYNSGDGTLGYPNVWITTLPSGANGWTTWVDNQTNGTRLIDSYAVCCRVPGR